MTNKITGRQIREIIRKLTNVDLSVPQIQKQGELTCWAGCYRMVDAYFRGTTNPFSDYLRIANPGCASGGCDFRPCIECDKPRNVSDIAGDLKLLAYNSTVGPMGKSLTIAEAREFLQAGRPILVFKDSGRVVGHFLLVTGLVMRGLLRNQCFIINDPDKHTAKVTDVLEFALQNGIWTDTWVIGV